MPTNTYGVVGLKGNLVIQAAFCRDCFYQNDLFESCWLPTHAHVFRTLTHWRAQCQFWLRLMESDPV